jgi:hypothetical protein
LLKKIARDLEWLGKETFEVPAALVEGDHVVAGEPSASRSAKDPAPRRAGLAPAIPRGRHLGSEP